jgi:hypothetical protein
MAYTQAQINAALATELAANPNLSQATLVEAGKSLGLSDAQINAAFDTIPGFNAQGQFDAADYIANSGSGFQNTQLQVDAANAARAKEYAANMEFLKTKTAQQSVVDPSTGQTKQLNAFNPDFNPNDPYTLAMLGSQVLVGDTNASNFFLMNPQYRPLADAAWAKEKARLDEIDRVNALAAQGQTNADQGKTMTSATKANPSALPAGFLESLTAIPNVTDQQIVAAMKASNVSPKNLADGLGISEGEVIARVAGSVPNGQTVQLGDTIIQPKYRVIGDGQDQQIGGLENVYTYRASDNKVGGGYTQYAADGTLERTGTQMKVNATQDFLKFAATAGALFGGAALAGIGEGATALTGTAAGTGLLTGAGGVTGLTTGAGGVTGLTTAGGLTGANTLLGGTLGSTLGGLTTGVGAGALTTAAGLGATALTASQIADLTKAGLTATQIGSLLSGGATTAAGLLQQQTSKEAAQKAQAMIEAETAAAKTAAQFRPVGMTTRFGTSQFTVDPVTGQLTSAGYTASPGVLEAQNRLVALGNQGLAQAEAAQGQFAPLQTSAQRLFELGQGYLAQKPEDVAQNYLNQQMALLQPGRELELANLQNKLQQQGRGGLAVAQGGALGDTTPELQALYNARAQQEAQLAANAQQYGQQNVAFGAGLLGTGAQTMGQYYAGQQAAYAPYTTALGQFTNLEQLAQQPLTMGSSLAQQSAQAGANMGQLGLRGAQLSTALATSQAATTNPYSTVLGGLGSSNTLGQGLGGLLGGGLQSAFSQTALGSSGFGTGLAYGNQDLMSTFL